MKTREDVEKLKQNWLDDPIFDLDGLDGFEEYDEELRGFQKEQEAKWRADNDNRLRKKATELGVSPEIAKQIDRLEFAAKDNSKKAKQLLVHYLGLSNTENSSDNQNEIEEIVDRIVDASTCLSIADFLRLSRS